MSGYELSVAAVCALVGYVVISALWPKSWRTKDAPAEDPGPARAEEARADPGPPPPPPGPESEPWHVVLGVHPAAPWPQVQQAYRELIAKYHPDKVASLGPELQEVAHRMTARLNAAYHEARSRAAGQ